MTLDRPSTRLATRLLAAVSGSLRRRRGRANAKLHYELDCTRVAAIIVGQPGRRWRLYGDLLEVSGLRTDQLTSVLGELVKRGLIAEGWTSAEPGKPPMQYYQAVQAEPQRVIALRMGQATGLVFSPAVGGDLRVRLADAERWLHERDAASDFIPERAEGGVE